MPSGVKASTMAPVLEVCVQRLEMKVCEWPALLFISGTLGAIRVCVRTPAVVPVLQAPCDTSELKNSRWLNSIHKPSSLLTPDLLQITLQIPQQEQTLTCCPGAVLLLSLQGVAVNLDPVLSTWILFQPQRTSTSRHTQQVSMRKRREDEASVGSTAHTHTSSPLKSRTVTVFPSSEEPPVSPEERMKNLITNTWNAVKQLTLQSVCDALVVCLPQISVTSAGYRHTSPLQDAPFHPRPPLEEGGGFPWTLGLSGLSVYSLRGHTALSLLDPLGCSSSLALTAPKLQSSDAFIVCVHVDLEPAHLHCTNAQVELVFSLWCRWSQVYNAFSRMQSSHTHTHRAAFQESSAAAAGFPESSAVGGATSPMHSSTCSPSADLGSAAEGASAHSEELAGCEVMTLEQKTCSISSSRKMSVWMQWMLPKLTLTLREHGTHSHTHIVCVMAELEELSSSVDIQDVYTKLKCKVGRFHIDHYRSGAAERWLFDGVILQCKETPGNPLLLLPAESKRCSDYLSCCLHVCVCVCVSSDALTSEVVLSCSEKLNRRTVLLRTLPQQEPLTHSSCFPPVREKEIVCDILLMSKPAAAKALEASHGFLSLTYTRAVTRNVRHRLTHRSQTPETHTLHSHPVDASPRFLHEILLNTQPFDLVLSPRLLRTLQSVFTLHTPEHILTPSVQRVHTSRRMRAQTQLCSSSLPLIYLNTSTIRIFCPLEEMHSHCTPDSQWKSRKEDTVVLKISSLCVTPQAENPLPRTVLRKDIYQRALSLGVVGEPGSEVEDRQYQLDLQGINMGTAAWHQLRAERERERGTSESRASTAQNPALEWNTASRIRHQQEKRVILSPIINDFSIRITAAPAVVYRKPSSAEEVLVCGHSLEMNVTSNLDLFLSVSQTHTLQQLLEETLNLTREETHNSKVSPAPSPPFAPPSVPMESVCGQDSGFGSDSARVRLAQVERHLTRPPPQLLPLHPKGGASSLSFVPFDIFLTAGRVSLMMFDHDTVEEEESGKKSWEAAAGHHETSSCLEAGTVQRDTSFRHCETILGEHQAESRQKDDSLGISETVTEDNVAGVRPREVTVDSNPGLGSPCPSGRQALGQTVVRAPGRRAEAHRYPLPLLFVQVNQPSAILSIHQRRQRMEISLFDLTLKGPNASYICHDTGKSLPEPQDYSVFWFQTTAGEPDARTGIPPPLLTVSIRDLLSRPELNMIISRPLRVTPTLAKIDQAKAIWEKLFSEKDNEALPRTQTAPAHNNEGPTSSSPKTTTDPSPHNSEAQMDFVPTTEVPHTFELLLSFFRSPVLFQKVTVNTVQLVLSLQMESGSAPPSLTLSLSSLTSAVKLNCANKPTECVSVSIQCGDALLRSSVGNRSAVFAGPFSFTAYIEADWCRHSGNPTPEVQGMPRVLMDVKGGLLQVFWGQLQHNCVSEMLHQLQNHWSDMAKVEVEPKDKPCSSDCVPPTSQSDQSEHSADDLRTGLFQYIQDPGRERIPVAQELVFWAESEDSPGVMLWRYTQSRIITHLRITPVPFNTCDDLEITTADLGDMLQVPCSLEYWDELQGVFVPYREFRLSESSVCELQLPSLTTHTPQSDLVTSDLWRIVLNSTGDPSDESSESEAGSDPLVCVSALAACTRVDSCFSPRFVPSFGLGLHLAHLEVHCCTHLDQLGTVPCHKLRPFLPDRKTPLEHEFAVVCVSNFSVFARQWCNRAQWSHALSFSSTLSCKLLEYRNLTLTPVVQPVALQAWGTHTLSHGHHTLQGDATLEPLHVRFGQYSIHTLERAMHAWSQNGQTDTEEVVFSHYVVCNDTQEVMRFGQVDTDESILLSSNQSHQYSWRSHRSPQLLHICLESLGNWRWAEPFSVDEVGTKLRTITNRGRTASLIIRVRELSGVQKQVLICGRQLFCSFLDISLELRIDHGCSGSETNQLINNFPAHSRLPSLVLENEELGSVSVRTSSELPWSSSVCMDQDSAVLQVACSDESVLHIWCHQISLEPNTHSQQRMVVFTPLFVIRSHLPDPVLVHVEKRSLGLTNSQIIHGRGHTHTLLGVEAEITHHLTFQPSEDEDASPCAVPVSTAVIKQIQARVDQNQNQQNLNPQELLDYFYGEKMDSTFPWPYCTREKERSGVVEPVAQWDSPMRVCLSVWRRGLNTLLVELLPWALLRNHTHSELWLFEGERILTQIPVGHTLVPPNLKEAFQIGVYWPDTNTVHKSAAVRLVHEELSPRWQEGGEAEVLLLDEEGYVHIDITLGTRPGSLKRCQFCLSSTVELGIQVLQIENRTVLLNHTTHSLRYRAATPQDPAVAPQQADTDLSIFTLPASVSDEVYLRSALPFWDVVCVAEPADAQLLFSLEETDPHWSTPALVRSDLPRQSVSVPVTPSKEWPFSTRYTHLWRETTLMSPVDSSAFPHFQKT
ncbi:hypothetical protein DNTS_006035 [Danionella cerebrum]|uniref:Uncharacterized protein n=1 Tax=Danionella cerebrum TaxID=2873325 RepID=A0A553Q047_9TELE|nr:hypothetical protein DNTS_006035 [Danionella translucida]